MFNYLTARIGERRGGLRARFAIEKWLEVCRDAGATGVALDIGCGVGRHLAHMREAEVFAELHGADLRPEPPGVGETLYHGDVIEDFTPPRPYDAIWCSHVMEHSENTGLFLAKIHELLREDGVLALIVPPLKHAVTVGHVNLYNPGVLMLNLLRAGFDCREIMLRRKGYNIAAILRRRPCPRREDFGPDPATSYRPYLPEGLRWRQNRRTGVWTFNGDIARLNWG